MKAHNLSTVALCALMVACSPPQSQNDSDQTVTALTAEIERLKRLKTQADTEREKLLRSILSIQAETQELYQNLDLASSEIWGDGSSTGARLATAKRAVSSIQVKLDDLSAKLR